MQVWPTQSCVCERDRAASKIRVGAASESLLSMLTRAVGDLTSVTIPITYMEPTSFLQRLCEPFQNSYLLDQVSSATTTLDRTQRACCRLLVKKMNSSGLA
jgi:hypothetical protein